VFEIPWFIEFQERYKDNRLSVIGVSIDESWKPVKAFIEEKKVNYAIVIDSEGVRRLYELNAMPMTLLINRSGEIAASYIGAVDKTACESKLRTLLQENALGCAEVLRDPRNAVAGRARLQLPGSGSPARGDRQLGDGAPPFRRRQPHRKACHA
jgi:AhpC/TSA family